MMKQKITFLDSINKQPIEIEIPDGTEDPFRMRAAVEIAARNGQSLFGANLTRADLAGANLTGANLTRADLAGANLTDADLTGAKLARADLTGANLTRANLTDANLTDANLADANLTGADLRGANLRCANLAGANLADADLRAIGADFFDVILRAIPEVPGLLAALREGRVDGSTYTGDCACLVGTIANVRGSDVKSAEFSFKDSYRPAERWFLAIRKGDTPNTNPVSKITEEWILEFMALVGADESVAS
jgi:uncharacterized protein YjbI with pentapeptide repeats